MSIASIDRRQEDTRTEAEKRAEWRASARRLTIRESHGRDWQQDNEPDVGRGKPIRHDSGWRVRRSA